METLREQAPGKPEQQCTQTQQVNAAEENTGRNQKSMVFRLEHTKASQLPSRQNEQSTNQQERAPGNGTGKEPREFRISKFRSKFSREIITTGRDRETT